MNRRSVVADGSPRKSPPSSGSWLQFALFGHPDFAKAAFADLFEQLVAAEHLCEGFLKGRFEGGGSCCVEGGSRQQGVVREVFVYQLLHLAAESGVLAARPLKIGCLRFGRGNLDGFDENSRSVMIQIH